MKNETYTDNGSHNLCSPYPKHICLLPYMSQNHARHDALPVNEAPINLPDLRHKTKDNLSFPGVHERSSEKHRVRELNWIILPRPFHFCSTFI